VSLLWEVVRKDLRIFRSDPRAVVISFAVPVVIATFMGFMTGGMAKGKPTTKLPILIVDQDKSAASAKIVGTLKTSEIADPKLTDEASARQQVNDGKATVAVIIPAHFAENAVAAMGGEKDKPGLTVLADPSKATEAQMLQGVLAQAVMKQIVTERYGESAGSMDLPYKVVQEKQKEQTDDALAGTSHAFAGMAVQGLFFWAIECAMGLLRERKQGIWKRLMSAPVSPTPLILGRLVSAAIRALMIVFVVFAAGALIFHLQVTGSYAGFALVAVAASLMAASFGLFVAALGKTEAQSRGLSILAVLTMMMLGGAWFPAFLMPAWIQTISLAVPVRWAVDGFDAMMWRGGGLTAALQSVAVLLAFTAAFAGISLARLQKEETA